MILRVRKIGNSAGIILSKSIMEQCHIKDQVSVEILDDSIILQPVKPKLREGWQQQFLNAGSLEENEKLMDINNSFDQEEWTWE